MPQTITFTIQTFAPGGGLATAIYVDVYNADDTWSKRPGAKWVEGFLQAPGGGGGAGRKIAGTNNASGGAGGAGGARNHFYCPASLFGDTEAVVVPVGGTGGASQATNSTNGNPGGTPSDTTFAGDFKANAGAGGGGGTTGTVTGPTGGTGEIPGT